MKRLRDRTILITRTALDAAGWENRIQDLGGSPVVLPCIHCEIQDDPATRTALRRAVEDCDWLMLTSARGVEATAQLLDGPLPEQVAIAVVGERTATIARQHWNAVQLVGDGGGARSLATRMAERLNQRARIVHATSDLAQDDGDAPLKATGAVITRVAVYRTIPVPAPDRPVRLDPASLDVILLASPSAVTGLTRLIPVPPHIDIITIGPTTSRAARQAGLQVRAEARRPDLEGMLEVIP